MKPVKFGACNMVYRGPTPDIGDLHVYRESPGKIRTVWELDDHERALIAAGGRVELVLYAEPIPPISLAILDERMCRPVGEHEWKVNSEEQTG